MPSRNKSDSQGNRREDPIETLERLLEERLAYLDQESVDLHALKEMHDLNYQKELDSLNKELADLAALKDKPDLNSQKDLDSEEQPDSQKYLDSQKDLGREEQSDGQRDLDSEVDPDIARCQCPREECNRRIERLTPNIHDTICLFAVLVLFLVAASQILLEEGSGCNDRLFAWWWCVHIGCWSTIATASTRYTFNEAPGRWKNLGRYADLQGVIIISLLAASVYQQSRFACGER